MLGGAVFALVDITKVSCHLIYRSEQVHKYR